MPIVKVWGLPESERGDKLAPLISSIAVAGASEKKLKVEPSEFDVFFPASIHEDEITRRLKGSIFVEVLITHKAERVRSVREGLAWKIGAAVKRHYPNSRVECRIVVIKLEDGYWDSACEEE